jgi:hypothetical protein
MIVLSVLVGLCWVASSYEIEGKTPIGHGLTWWKKQQFFADKTKPQKKQPKKKETARPTIKPAPQPQEKEATAKRVALLEKAAQAIERDAGNPGAKTSVGEKPSSKDKKALDELLTSRLPRGR